MFGLDIAMCVFVTQRDVSSIHLLQGVDEQQSSLPHTTDSGIHIGRRSGRTALSINGKSSKAGDPFWRQFSDYRFHVVELFEIEDRSRRSPNTISPR